MEEEHDRLEEMIAAASFAILHIRKPVPRLGALRLLRQRFALHCQFEENLAETSDDALVDLLRDDHRDLLAMLDLARDSLIDGDDGLSRSTLTEFRDSLARHDEAVDSPLFRLMAGAPAEWES